MTTSSNIHARAPATSASPFDHHSVLPSLGPIAIAAASGASFQYPTRGSTSLTMGHPSAQYLTLLPSVVLFTGTPTSPLGSEKDIEKGMASTSASVAPIVLSNIQFRAFPVASVASTPPIVTEGVISDSSASNSSRTR